MGKCGSLDFCGVCLGYNASYKLAKLLRHESPTLNAILQTRARLRLGLPRRSRRHTPNWVLFLFLGRLPRCPSEYWEQRSMVYFTTSMLSPEYK